MILTATQTEGYYYPPVADAVSNPPFAAASAPPAIETDIPPVADPFMEFHLASSATRLSLPPTDYDLGSLHGSVAPSPLSTTSAPSGATVPTKRKRGRPRKHPVEPVANGGSLTPRPKPNGKASCRDRPGTAARLNGKAAGKVVVTREEVCGFCQLPDMKNEIGPKEKLISCTMCGRSGHPICLGFSSPEIKKIIMSYPWCCIDCKPCEACRHQGDDVSLARRMQLIIRTDYCSAMAVIEDGIAIALCRA